MLAIITDRKMGKIDIYFVIVKILSSIKFNLNLLLFLDQSGIDVIDQFDKIFA